MNIADSVTGIKINTFPLLTNIVKILAMSIVNILQAQPLSKKVV